MWGLTYPILGETTTGDYIPLAYWSDLELNIGIACLCMPSLRVIIRRYFPGCSLTTSTYDSRTDQYNRPSNRPSDHASAMSAKMPRNVTRQVVVKDSSSDQIELFPYNGNDGRVS